MRAAAVLNTTTWTDVSAVIYLKKWVAYKRINECWAAGVILDWNMNIMCRLNGSGSEEFFFPSWLPDIKWVALIQRLRRGSAVESNRMCVGQKCVDGVSGCSGFFQTAAGNLTLTFTCTCSHCALWGHRAPLRWVRGQSNGTHCQQDFFFNEILWQGELHSADKQRWKNTRGAGLCSCCRHTCAGL